MTYYKPELWSFKPNSKDSVLAYQDHLLELRNAALARPLHESDELAVQTPRIGDSTVSPTDKLGRGRPSIPWLLQDISSSASLVLRKCLQAGPNKWSQVWQCDIVSTKARKNTAAPTVIVKIFQESLGPIPSWNEYQNIMEDDYIPMRIMREREYLAYETLKPLQGDIVPYSYGFYSFILPCGETAIGHIMEFLQGPILYDWALAIDQDVVHKRPINTAEISRIFEVCMRGVEQMNTLGVWHRDVSWHNIIYDSGNPVFIDFGQSIVEPPSDPREVQGHWEIPAMLQCLNMSRAFRPLVGEWKGTCRRENPDVFRAYWPLASMNMHY